MISLIVAMDEGGTIGAAGGLPWRNSADMRYFRETTTGRSVIMGRRTFEGLKRPLPNRLNIVLTRDPRFAVPEGVIVTNSADEALSRAGEGEVFVAGGAGIYALFLPRADRLYITRIAGRHAGDTRFPDVDWASWRLVWSRTVEDCRFERYERPAGGRT